MEPMASKGISGHGGGGQKKRKIITIRGIVQGVGFRPFIFSHAQKYNLKGFVANDTSGVHIDVEGSEESIEAFIGKIAGAPPPLARIDDIKVEEKNLMGYKDFEIRDSAAQGMGFIPVSPDMATCEDCLKEMFEPADRRYRYPFINCTNCGPRFSIIEDIPYDRPRTSMKDFPMCRQCENEYKDPRDRRFHAQPVACPVCGPEVFFVEDGLERKDSEVNFTPSVEKQIDLAASVLKRGGILAIKGLGGFHLAVNALDDTAVRRLRQRKFRYGKPLAVMMKDIEEVKKYCVVDRREEEILKSQRSPILLLKKKAFFRETEHRQSILMDPESFGPRSLKEEDEEEDKDGLRLAESVAPGLDTVGVMLPYTPLHHLLMRKVTFPLVMTSGNVSDEPICRDNDEAIERLKNIADGFLVHNRRIVNRIDDSVAFYAAGKERLVRRARGYAPEPVILEEKAKPLIACGSFYKNTFCLARDEYAFVSHHIGDLDNEKAFQHYTEQVERYKKLFRVNPLFAVRDLHPGYLSSQFAESLGLPVLSVQHHHAHIASVMVEYGLKEKVLGIVYDGTGLGADGHIWGAEFLLADFKGFKRVGHLKYVPIPGGDAAVKNPFRTALGFIYPFYEDFREFAGKFDKKTVDVIRFQIQKGINSPLASSMGRLFDAASSLIGLCHTASYEGQAAMELEAVIRPDDGFYEYEISNDGPAFIIDAFKILKSMYNEFIKGTDRGIIAARFHNTVVKFTAELAVRLRDIYSINRIVLSGGCFQNRYLVEKLNDELLRSGFEVFIPSRMPANDGGLSLGQAAIGVEYFRGM